MYRIFDVKVRMKMAKKAFMGLWILALALAVSMAGGAEAVLEIPGDLVATPVVELAEPAEQIAPEQAVEAVPQPVQPTVEQTPAALTLVDGVSDVVVPSAEEAPAELLEVVLYDWFGDVLDRFHVTPGETIEKPSQDPELRGARFVFWFDASIEEAEEFDFSAPIVRDTELYPLFIFESSVSGMAEEDSAVTPEQLMDERAEALMNDILGLVDEKVSQTAEQADVGDDIPREHPDIKPAEDLISTILEEDTDESPEDALIEEEAEDLDAGYVELTIAQQNSLRMGILGIAPDGESDTLVTDEDGIEGLPPDEAVGNAAESEGVEASAVSQAPEVDEMTTADLSEADGTALQVTEEETPAQAETDVTPLAAPQDMYVVVEPDQEISDVLPGSVVTLRARVENLPEGYTVLYQWQSNENGAYADIPGATESEYSFVVDEGSANVAWKVEVSVSNEM